MRQDANAREAEPVNVGAMQQSADASLETVLKSSIEAIEREHIAEALARAGGNRTQAAKTLSLSRQTLHAKLKKYRLGTNN